MIPFLIAALLGASPAPAAPPRAAPRPPTTEEIESAAAAILLRASAGEPSLRDVQREAARHALRTLGVLDGRAARRARLSALLPKVSLELQRDDRRYRVVGLTSSSEVDYVRHTPGNQVSVRLSWDLAALGFADAEIKLADRAEAAAKAREAAVERATRLWFERRRLVVALEAAPPPSAPERAEREVEIEELGGMLDALTGGAWSQGSAR